MALPTKDKTWQISANNAVGGTLATATDNASVLFAIKTLLKSFSSFAWVVWGSCDGGGGFGNNDGNDRWTDLTDVVWAAAGSNHSWMVLTQTAMGGSAQICMDLSNASTYAMTLAFSPGGLFTGGTATARPTATDELLLISNTNWGGYNGAFYSRGLHVMESNDGKCTRVIICRSNATTGLWLFETAKEPITAWSSPYFGAAIGNQNVVEQATHATFNDLDKAQTKISSSTVTMYMTSSWTVGATAEELITVPDEQTREWPVTPIGLASLTASHRGGRKGKVYDLWWGSPSVQIGTTYPEDGTKILAQFGHLIFPWDGTTTPRMN